MKTAAWVLAVVIAMAAVLGGFWYGMVHAKRPLAPAPAGMAPPPPIKTDPTGDMHQGIEESAALLLTVEPTAQDPGDGSHIDFLMLSDDSGDCTPEDHPATVQNASIDKINVLPAGPDGRQDVEILASVGRTAVKPTDTDCPDAPEKKYRLLCRNKGDHFEVADGAAAIQALAGKDGDTGKVVC